MKPGQRVHLDFVALHFSTRCSAKCSFCYSSDPQREKITPTPLSEVDRILSKLAADGVGEVLFVGGDPVVHPNFVESLHLAKAKGLAISVLSNTWSIRPDSKFREAIGLIDNCEATVLGASAATHDAITQSAGSYERLVANLQKITACGREVGICVNAMPQNLDEIYDLVRRLRDEFKVRVRSLMIQRIIPSGGASGEFKFGLNLNDVDRLMQQIDRVATEFGLPIHFEDPVPWCTVKEKYHHYLAKCQWGYTRGSINNQGLLNRCGADDQYRLGSIWDGDVQETWRNHPILQSFRSKQYLPEECQSCALLDRCGGGCPLSCGTHHDHDVDQLYVQRVQSDQVGSFTPNAPAGNGYEALTTRYAYAGDLPLIVALESQIFPNGGPLFKAGKIETLFNRCPKAFRVVSSGSKLVGYSVIFPLTAKSVERVKQTKPNSVIVMELEDLAERFTDSVRGYFLEVVATVPDAPARARVALLRDAQSIISRPGVTVYASPITPAGESLLQRGGFSVFGKSPGGDLYIKEPVFEEAAR